MFADFEPKLSDASRGADVLFLANIQPDLQRQVRAQCAGARFVALDSMNLWIDTARDSLIETIAEVDCLLLNDAELRQLTDGAEPRPRGAARSASGARAWSSPSRASTAPRWSPRRASSGCRRSRSRPSSIRPARATASPAGSSATSRLIPTSELDHELLCRAMAYGTALASFNVEEFGTERVARLTGEEIAERVGELAADHAASSRSRSRCAADDGSQESATTGR